MGRITLLTDFGTRDGYVAAMKGVIASIAPAAWVHDAAHDIEPGDVHAAAWVVDGYWRLYPPGTVHVVVVDPGVGSERRAIACAAAGHLFVGPDNGVFSRVLRSGHATQVVVLENPAFRRPEVSATFHGRDLFAPAAAHLATGVALHELGAAIRDACLLPEPGPVREPYGVRGAVVHIDRFGNLITNIPGSWIEPGAHVRIGRHVAPVVRTYSEARPGELLALVGSRHVLEIAVRDGSAAERMGSHREVELHVDAPRTEPAQDE